MAIGRREELDDLEFRSHRSLRVCALSITNGRQPAATG
jgi:hypothetical protein